MARKNEADQLREAKRAYQEAVSEGNRAEEARWANAIGHLLKNRGEYVKALSWLRKDHDISTKYLPEKQLLPTCQSLGELHLRLQNYQDALIFQKKHLELAKDMNDLVEQQRANTQLGRTYHEMFLNSENDHSSVRNAKKYFKSAMGLVETLKKNTQYAKFSFVKEYVDAHNNLGMLELDIDNLEEAQRILTKGLKICDEEEVTENDDGRSRLHHNLGNVYMMARRWDKAEEHITKDINICRRIGHCQGEAKGYINLGELYYKVQKYDEAMRCYQKARDLAKSMEDEDALVKQIDQNIETVKEATKVMDDIKKEEQHLKKLARNMENASGSTTGERKCLLQQLASLDRLIEKSSLIFAWLKHREYAKKKKRIAGELCDKEKLADSFLAVGESYEKLRKFKKALKWYMKSWNTYKLIGNLEGQALAKIDIGDILDSDGDWRGAYDAFQEAYRTAVEAKLPSIQLSALENMHYSQMIRFDNVEQARSLQSSINKLKVSIEQEMEANIALENHCSETETETDEHSPDKSNDRGSSENNIMSYSSTSTSRAFADDLNENSPLVSFLRPGKSIKKIRTAAEASASTSKQMDSSPMSKSKSTGSLAVGCKRVRLVLSDDECNDDEEHISKGVANGLHVEDVATSNGSINRNIHDSPAHLQGYSPVVLKCTASDCGVVSHEDSSCSERSRISKFAKQCKNSSSLNDCKIDIDVYGNLFNNHNVSGPNIYASCHGNCDHILVKINGDILHMQPHICILDDNLSIERMKVEVACLYYLQLHFEKRAKGLVPVIQEIKYDGRSLETPEAALLFNDPKVKMGMIEVLIGAWVPKPVMMYYTNFCRELSAEPNLNILKKLYNLEVSEDEVIVSDCELQDISIAPLLKSLEAHKTIAVINLSHNMLGNGTMEKLQHVFASSGQKYGGLVLDLHNNRLGSTSLFQVCECPVLFSRLEVLNIAGNRLTDACASYLSTILKNCKALYALNIEQCSVTSRTIQKIADSLDGGSVLTHLYIGYNNPISGNAVVALLLKIAALTRFQELSLSGIKLSKLVVDRLCQLSQSSCLSSLLLGGTGIGNDGALQLTKSLAVESRELVQLDLSSNGLISEYAVKLSMESCLLSCVIELNLAENPLEQEGAKALSSLLGNPQCCIKVLVLRKCQLGLAGVLQILEALSDNCCLEELNLAGNLNNVEENHALQQGLLLAKEKHNPMQTMESETCNQELCAFNMEEDNLVVADSDDEIGEFPLKNADGLISVSSSDKNLPYPIPQFFYRLLSSIKTANKLKVLDLSDNKMSENDLLELRNVWSSSDGRAGVAQCHIKDDIVHLSVQGYKCCGMRPCCRRI